MKKVFFLLCFVSSLLNAQVQEKFNDFDFSNFPAWSGDTAKWAIENELLRSNSSIPNDTFFMATPSLLSINAQWEFFVNLKFSTSGTNYTDVYLTCDSLNLKAPTRSGYFVRIGNTSDEICLYKCKKGTNTKIIDGINGITNTTNNIFKIKVSRSADYSWTLKRDSTGIGFNYITEGTATDSTFTTSSFFGILVKQSTASFHLKHFFDDIEVIPLIIDTTSPFVNSIHVISSSQIDVLFSEYVDKVTSEKTSNYFVDSSIDNPLTAIRDNDNPALVHLTFAATFTDSLLNTLTINNVKDFEENVIVNLSNSYTYYAPIMPIYKDVIINELFPDPSPRVNLPEVEFVEVYNRSTKTFNIKNWQLGDASGTSVITFFDDTLSPDEYLILCKVTDTSLFNTYGRVIGMSSFPSLNNSGDDIYLIGSNGLTVDSVSYTDDWYNNTTKKEGGWTMELINKKASVHCPTSTNWNASANAEGGTPGKINSVSVTDILAPQLVSVTTISADTVILLFSEVFDTNTINNLSLYEVDKEVGNPSAVRITEGKPSELQLIFTSKLQEGVIYTITVLYNSIKDCAGNVIGSGNKQTFVIPQKAVANDLVINEILTDPTIGGVDFVEIYNRSTKIIDLKTIFVSQFDTINNLPLSLKKITNTSRLIYPQEYILISENGDAIKNEYHTVNAEGFVNIEDLPSMNVANAAICLTTSNADIIDYFIYDETMHFALLNETKGVSLERIDFNRPTNERTNWHSAAQTIGFATPAYENSQYNDAKEAESNVEISPELFSPDEDGVHDILNINYRFDENGYVGNITIYDSKGRLTKRLVKNELLSINGTYSWDGINEFNEKSNIGIYIIYFEVFDLAGKQKQFKKTAVLASKLE